MKHGDISASDRRQELFDRFFPRRIPALWCPAITHYDDEGGIDRARTAAHLKFLSPWVKGFLVPGSTGDGWEMSEPERRKVLEVALEEAVKLDLHVLVGLLKTDGQAARQSLLDTLAWLKSLTGTSGAEDCLVNSRVCGFTVCPPKGKGLSQEQMATDLEAVLRAGLPTALYQLPQVTQNEMDPELTAGLASQFGNFILFKDTSGADRVALSGKNLGGIFLVRGAEGDYARWLKSGGGPYDGFLLSTANCFGRELQQMIEHLEARRMDAANGLSERLTGAVNEVFRLVHGLPHGNPFANANKAMDHFFAHGPKAAGATSPRLHAGSHLPPEVIRATGEALARYQLMPGKGYLE